MGGNGERREMEGEEKMRRENEERKNEWKEKEG